MTLENTERVQCDVNPELEGRPYPAMVSHTVNVSVVGVSILGGADSEHSGGKD